MASQNDTQGGQSEAPVRPTRGGGRRHAFAGLPELRERETGPPRIVLSAMAHGHLMASVKERRGPLAMRSSLQRGVAILKAQ
ncbi:hypothetical protein AAFF_G00435650 [Aldrovandia affinis]|uniref:Uncharacterized protein n=1 Tax=Aldrovandia affinis TaxID=143900 RepID=A0AAD7S8B6_9TELE|nr:hypothetical protein AAFF_G00435650 [Aldrovandia affinis]